MTPLGQAGGASIVEWTLFQSIRPLCAVYFFYFSNSENAVKTLGNRLNYMRIWCTFFTLIHISKPLWAANDEKETKNESKKKICYLLRDFDLPYLSHNLKLSDSMGSDLLFKAVLAQKVQSSFKTLQGRPCHTLYSKICIVFLVTFFPITTDFYHQNINSCIGSFFAKFH